MTFESLKNTKRTGSGNYLTVSVPSEINEELNIICNELQCSKLRFVTLALSKMIDEYKKTYGSFTEVDND